ncbi:MAG: redoxin family protein [Terrimonas sp.]|nr:redoxin family protein [Terrimonas sp.]
MKKLFATIIPIAAIFVVSFTTQQPSLAIGSGIPQPDRPLQDVSGKEVSLNKAFGTNGLLVMFSCNTCPYVIKNQSRTNEICRYALKNDLGVILLNANEGSRNGKESLTAMQAYAQNQGFDWYYAVDKMSVLANEFDANRTPECFLFNNDKKLAYHGAIDNNPADPSNVSRKHLKIAIEEMISGQEVSVKETRSVGCGISRVE